MRPAIVFVTDFGAVDGYAAALEGACLATDPAARCVHGSHGIPAGDVAAGAYTLATLANAFPSGTVLCGVVDPGVGGSRRALGIAVGGIHCVAPDNGLVHYLWHDAPGLGGCVELPVPPSASDTFHGRDVFAPAAARLAAGARLDDLGRPASPPRLLDDLLPLLRGDTISATVVHVDHFGNCILGVRRRDVAGRVPLAASWEGGRADHMVRTYVEISERLALLWGSGDHLEIAAKGRRAVDCGGPRRGQGVVVTLQ